MLKAGLPTELDRTVPLAASLDKRNQSRICSGEEQKEVMSHDSE